MKKILTVMAMFLMLTGKANAGIEEYKHISDRLKNGRLKIFIAPTSSTTDDILEANVENEILASLIKAANSYGKFIEISNFKSYDDLIPSYLDFRNSDILQYAINISVRKMPAVAPSFELAEIHDYGDNFSTTYKPSSHAGEQLLAVNIITSLIWDNSRLIPYLSKIDKNAHLTAISICKQNYERHVNSFTIPIYNNKNNLKEVGLWVITNTLMQANLIYYYNEKFKENK